MKELDTRPLWLRLLSLAFHVVMSAALIAVIAGTLIASAVYSCPK